MENATKLTGETYKTFATLYPPIIKEICLLSGSENCGIKLPHKHIKGAVKNDWWEGRIFYFGEPVYDGLTVVTTMSGTVETEPDFKLVDVN